jgi:hypothetical protein
MKYTTFVEAMDNNISKFKKERDKLKNSKKDTSTQLKSIDEKEIEYLLDTIPFIKEYVDDQYVVEKNKMFSVASKTTNTDAFYKYLNDVEGVNTKEYEQIMKKESQAEKRNEYTCQECGGHLLHHAAANDLICEKCGKCYPYVEEDVITRGVVYKRINHLTDRLNALQGKERTDIPTEVVEAVKAEFKKLGVSMSDDIEYPKVREFLKKLGYTMYYENVHTIANIISGRPMIHLKPELEKQFKDMFFMIQIPFYNNKPAKRKNFLSYNFCLYKFAELLGEDHLLPYFPLLKCSRNLHKQDQIWKKICADLSWEFLPTSGLARN